MKGFILLVLCIILFGCQNRLKTETKYNNSLIVKLEIDSICIPLDSISLSSYPSATFIYSTDHCTIMYAFNTKTWMIDVFDIENKCLANHIMLDKEGNNGVSYINSIQVLSPDSIICFDDNGFLMLDDMGKVFHRETMIYSGDDYVGHFEGGQFTQSYYDQNNNKVYGRLITSKEPYPYPAEQPLFAEYDINNKKWEFIPITLPLYMKENWQHMGQNRHLNMWIGNNQICYNFSCFSDLFTYSIPDRKKSVAGGESRMVNNDVSPYTGDLQNEKARWEHWIDNPIFYMPIYDKYRKCYYRIQTSELKDDFSGVPTPYDKKIILGVFNKELEMISEFQLDNYKYNFVLFGVTKDGLIVDGNNPKDTTIDYEYLKLYRLKID